MKELVVDFIFKHPELTGLILGFGVFLVPLVLGALSAVLMP